MLCSNTFATKVIVLNVILENNFAEKLFLASLFLVDKE